MVRCPADWIRLEIRRPERETMDDFTEQLKWLFENVPAPDGRRITTERLVTLIAEHEPSVRMSVSYAGALRQGAKTNPSASVIDAIARAFGIPAAYFFDPALRGAIQDGVRGLTSIRRDAVIKRLCEQIPALTDEQLMRLVALVDGFTPPTDR